jgi:hypothetical protein
MEDKRKIGERGESKWGSPPPAKMLVWLYVGILQPSLLALASSYYLSSLFGSKLTHK